MEKAIYRSKQSGFTLIELSIVLLIIALIVGGVMVGKDMIRSAAIRSTISQKERFSTAANTFQLKYNCLPGDCSKASSYGFTQNGNGDGVIYAGGNDDTEYYFWIHLYQSNLITEKPAKISGYTLAGDSTPTCPICNRTTITIYGAPYFQVGGWQVIDLSALSSSLGCGVFGTMSPYPVPSFRVLALADANFAGGGFGAVIKPIDGYAIDSKIDDGRPYTGSVIAFNPYMYSNAACSGFNGLPALSNAGCTNHATNTYSTATDDACFNLLINANF